MKFANIDPNSHIKKVIVIKTNRVYLATIYNNKVYELINDSLYLVYKFEIPFPENSLRDMEINENGDVFLAGIATVIRVSETDAITCDSDSSAIPDEFIEDIFLDKNDNLWITFESYSDTAVLRFNGTSWDVWERSFFYNTRWIS